MRCARGIKGKTPDKMPECQTEAYLAKRKMPGRAGETHSGRTGNAHAHEMRRKIHTRRARETHEMRMEKARAHQKRTEEDREATEAAPGLLLSSAKNDIRSYESIDARQRKRYTKGKGKKT